MIQEEVWKDIIGFEERYSVSNLGRVFSKYRNRLVSLNTNQGGYLFFMAKWNGKVKNLLVHRQVALCFLEPPTEELIDKCSNEHHGLVIVNHIDGIKTNNTPENLEWTDGKGNMQHASENNLLSSHGSLLSGVNSPKAVVKDQAIIDQIRSDYIKYDRKHSAKALAEKYGLTEATVKNILTKRTYK